MHKKYYDPIENRLIYAQRKATKENWDKLWSSCNDDFYNTKPRCLSLINKTKQYLDTNSRVLEGGCGLGALTYALDRNKFDAVGLDFAPQVIKRINKHWGHLNVVTGDVMNLPFDDASFDGYWSLGVIEHFPDGYELIASEMKRVIKSGGFLFLTFPSMNGLRKSKALSCKYDNLNQNLQEMKDFYQFALDPLSVINNFSNKGFILKERSSKGTLHGIEDEIKQLSTFIKYLNSSSSRLTQLIDLILDRVIGHYFAHVTLLVFEKI
ncbi:SAM-dependent methyltransferase [bacterium]|nr:SAM-dependent methyltransferase [bacterium]|tara:strand:- start:371 stop:1168 length:798 start_codon:yes stop_codon:yes gene_type:complete